MPRIAILSDIHGNLHAFESVVEDLKQTSPDLVLHGGDLADGGSDPVAIVDQIQELGWHGVLGNTDEMLFRPEALDAFSSSRPALSQLLDVVRQVAAATREELGEKRLAWMSALPRIQYLEEVALLHASPDSAWQSPGTDAEQQVFDEAYGRINRGVIVYGHIHHPFVRIINGRTFINSGSVGLPYDGDRRASYVLIDGGKAQIRRVEYDVDREIVALRRKQGPGCDWIVRMLSSARGQLP